MKAKEEHFKSITPEHLESFKNHNAFCCYASSSGKLGLVELGVNGNGIYVVRNNGITDFFSNPIKSILFYKRLLK